MKILRALSFCTAFTILCVLSLAAQSFRGGIQGTVKDQNGSLVTNAKLTVSNPETGLSRTVMTDATGTYFVSELPVGTYEVSAEKAGFSRQSRDNVLVEVSTSRRVDFQLASEATSTQKSGSTDIQEVVDASTASSSLDVTTNNLGGKFDLNEVLQLPTNNSYIVNLIHTLPGVGVDSAGDSDGAGGFALFSMNGARGRANDYLIDGTDANDGFRNLPAINYPGAIFGVPSYVLPVDAVQEMSVLSSGEAEYRSAGATVDVVTRAGGNALHGTAYEYFRNNALDARNFFNPAGFPQNTFHDNLFGISLGGPIAKDKTFFFVSYQGQYGSLGFPSIDHVPALSDYRAAIIALGGDPTQCATTVNACIQNQPTGVVNPVIAALIGRDPWPSPNRAPDVNGNNLLATDPSTYDDHSVIAKIDRHFGYSDFLTGRYFYSTGDQSLPSLGNAGVLPGFNTTTPAANVNVFSLSYVHIFDPQLLAEIRGGFARFHTALVSQDSTFNPASIGLNTGVSQQDFGLPQIHVANFTAIGSGLSDPRGRTDLNSQFNGNFTYTQGRHNWKFGYEFRRSTVDSFFDNGYRGSLAFVTLEDFLSGTPTGFSRQAKGNSSRQTAQNTHGFFVQDNFRVTSRFTLNYGLRWDYFGVLGEAKNRFSLLAPDGTPAGNLHTVSQLYPRDLKDFAPRLSFSYDLWGNKTVLRGGWGLYYDNFSQDYFLGQLPFNTFNSGPAYNGVGSDPVTFSFSTTPQIQPGVPVFTNFGATDVFTVDQNFRTPYLQEYNLNVEQALGNGVAFQIGYVGSQGRHLHRYVDLNQVNPATGTVAFPARGFVNQIQSSASSGYNALQASLRLLNWHGVTSSLNYTWSHSIDNASDGLDYIPNTSQPDNSFHPAGERGNSNFDQRQRMAWMLSYSLPAAKNWRRLTSGWVLNSVLTASKGQPFNVNYLFEGNFNGSGEGFGRPDLVGNPFAGVHTPDSFLNLSAFQIPCTLDNTMGKCVAGTQHFGNLGRNAFVGPGYVNYDFGVSKTTSLTERIQMQLRMDAFNLFNHANFANPLWAAFGVDFLQNGANAQGRGVGFLPITQTPDVGAQGPFLVGGGPRTMQLSLRFTF